MRSPSVAGSGSAAATTSRGATSTPFTRIFSFESRPSLCSVFSTSMNSSPSPYLNVTRLQSIQRGTSRTSSCSTFTHSTGPIPSGKSKTSGSENGRGREPAALLLPDHGRVQALLDRRPDGEGGREVVALDDEVRAVADADLVDLREELVGRISGEDVSRAGLDADSDEREEPFVLPGGGALELVVAELDADLLVRLRRVRLGERHRHVEVRHAGLEARVEDPLVEDGSTALRTASAPVSRMRREDVVLARGVDGVRAEPAVVQAGDDVLRALGLVVGERAALEERAASRDRGERGPDAARSDNEELHGARILPDRAVRQAS